jgi:hypothetical protein
LGGLAGFELTGDYTGAIVGSLAGALGGKGAQKYAANMLASPGYQAALKLRDLRSPLTPAEINYSSNMLVPYEAPVEVLMPGQGPYQPNFVMQPNQYAPQVTPVAPDLARALPAPSAQATMAGLRAEQQRAAGMSRTLGQQAEAQQAAAEAAARRPARGGVELVFDAAGNLVEAPPTRAGGAIGAPSSLESAVQKLSGQVIEQPSTSYKTMTISPKTGAQPYTRIIKKEGETTFERGVSRAFDLTAEERIAWNKAKADLAEVAPGFKALSDKAVAAKMMDRAWMQDAVGKAQEKARAFEQIAARANTERARQAAIADRERMLDLVADLEERLSAARPDTSRRQQGPKTRAAKRNALAPDNQNNLAP